MQDELLVLFIQQKQVKRETQNLAIRAWSLQWQREHLASCLSADKDELCGPEKVIELLHELWRYNKLST